MADYVIVGAGITGLSIAEYLLKKGHSVCILEKYGKVGGRIATFRDSKTGQQYEMGAGRIHTSHKRVHALIKRFGLHTYPINDQVVWHPQGGQPEPDTTATWLYPAIVSMLETLPPKTLATHTIAELLTPTWRSLLNRFPYWAEVHMLRADLAAAAFKAEMGTYGGYVGIKEGIDAITTGLAEVVAKKGADIHTRHRVADIRKATAREGSGYVIVGDYGKKAEVKPFELQAKRVIIATCRCSLGKFSVLNRHPLLSQLQTSPLLRIYATYPTHPNPVWFASVPKTVTDSPLRFVIPIDPAKGVIMISYTDGDDTKHWMNLEGPALAKAIHREVQRLYGKDVPPPLSVEKYPWPGGCTYWVPGNYDVDTAIEAAMKPQRDLWVVGESVAKHQAWIESALVSVETFIRDFKHSHSK